MISDQQKNPNYIALHAMCKEKLEDIIEWIEYHLAIGIDYFILYNNDNTQNIYEYLPDNLKQVTDVVDWFHNFNGRQILAQKDCIRKYSHFRWIGFLDIDEYIVLLDETTNIKNYLEEYEEFDGVCLHWLFFGANNHFNRQQSTIFSYTQSCPNHGANEHIKSIINPKKYKGQHGDPHWIQTKGISVNTLKEKIYGPFGNIRETNSSPIINHKMRINHYYTKSLEDFRQKQMRKGGNKVDREYTEQHFNSIQKENVYNDDIIQLYTRIKNGNH